MAAVYTNVTSATHGSAIPNVKSFAPSGVTTPLREQSDGSRTPAIVGDGAKMLTATLEVSDTGADLNAKRGFANKASLVVTTQLENAPATVKTHTMTNMVLVNVALSTNQDNPNGYTLQYEQASDASTWSIA